MKLLLDAHIFLWYISGDKRLSDDKRASIQDLNNEVYLSVVSIWEAIIKYHLGKLQLPQPPEVYLPVQREKHQILSLTLDEKSVAHLAQLPSIHRDPFDRMMICQANVHGLMLMTDDEIIHKYPVQILK
ncbi:MAG: type II toxin-antitoxin system VapC family toxin [candidate division KSB1 bacterium]|nr:type II toxin-antitoxin system VapC family toxin [candidate division KSB1 bacterium]MDZ7368811.1 type II toxin-antitoxin system VapC family toxin [candidate division KSB1 bacterium]MDZ7406655.1 type II toxin-antitoxin system VapC family toxin [candidate division KSB1 bacterium]